MHGNKTPTAAIKTNQPSRQDRVCSPQIFFCNDMKDKLTNVPFHYINIYKKRKKLERERLYILCEYIILKVRVLRKENFAKNITHFVIKFETDTFPA